MKTTLRKISCANIVVSVVIVLILEGWFCNGEREEVINIAEMEKSEKQNLYEGIQGFVGDWWNGSDLYPDPCGWTPIQCPEYCMVNWSYKYRISRVVKYFQNGKTDFISQLLTPKSSTVISYASSCQGVSCDFMDGFWYVTDLNIGPFHDNSLTCAEIPQFRPQIFNLKRLKSLSFYNCFSSHYLITLPTDIWSNFGSTLESLEFRSNPSLIGPIPSSIGGLRLLQSLVVIENGISGDLPSDIGGLQHLKRLVLSGNKFTGRIGDKIGNLSELLILDLSRNSLSGNVPSSIRYLKSILKLDLSNNFLTGRIPEETGDLMNLTLLDLGNNNLSGGLTKSIEKITSLEELVLTNNPIRGEITNFNWEKLRNLMILDLSNVGLSGEIPKSISKMKKLRYLGLNNNNLTGNLPTEMANMPCVGSIYVNGNNLTGVLNYSEGIYGRLGRRFKGWGNPNLCYIGGIISSEHAPIGVDPCMADNTIS